MNVPSFSIRRATKEDIPLIQALTGKVWPVTYEKILPAGQIAYMIQLMYSRETLEQQMDQEQEFYIVSEGAEPVGFAAFGPDAPASYKLHKIYILPGQQGKGTGKYLLEALAGLMREKAGRLMRLNVNRNNPAVSFYQKLGFSISREEDLDIGQGYFMNDYVMEKPL